MAFTHDDCLRCRADFPALARTQDDRPLVFLDGPAGTQVPRIVIEAVTDYYRRSNANTHGAFVTSAETDTMIGTAREAVAAFLGAPSSRTISFGANMTTLAFALAHALGRTMQPGDEILITTLDHEANRGPWLMLEERGILVREVALQAGGTLDVADMQAKVTDRTRIIAIGLASNALGTVNDIALARRLADRCGARLVLDAVHYAPHFPIDVVAMNTDFLLCSAYKFYGPHVGILYAREGLLERLPVDRLRTQESSAPERIETGTLNHAALAGVGAVIDYLAGRGEGQTLRERLVDAMGALNRYEHELARNYHEQVRSIPGVTVWGPSFGAFERAPTVSITLDGNTATEVARALGEQGIQVWDGHFYAARCVEALGLEEKGGLVRVGFSMYNTFEEIDRLLDALARLTG